MATTKTVVRTAKMSSPVWGIEKNKKYMVVRSFWFNGESWVVVKTLDDGRKLEVPEIFFV